MISLSKFIKIFFILVLFSEDLLVDDFVNNIYNNHGSVGLINMPSARFYDESSFGITVYDGTPDQKVTLTSSPFDWLEASFFYTNIQGLPYPGYEYQDYKDKGFNVKMRLKEQGVLPAIAVGINDLAGTGFYSGEYVVSSYELNNIDFHFGLGWGTLNGKNDFKNPLSLLDERFKNRPTEFEDQGGQFQPSRYYSDENVSAFGFSYILNDRTLFKFERDTTSTDSQIDYQLAKSDFSYGWEYRINKNLSIGLFNERDNFYSLKFIYKQNPKQEIPRYKYIPPKIKEDTSSYEQFIANLNNNGIGVNKIIKKGKIIGVDITQFIHPNVNVINEIIDNAKSDSSLTEEVLVNYKIVDLSVIENYDNSFEEESEQIYIRNKQKGFNSSTKFNFRPFLASREGFFKGALLLENDSEYLFADNLIFSSNLKYSLWNNFDDLVIPPRNTYPAQVRSDVKDYLRGFNDGIVIGRAQIDFYQSLKNNHHIMVSAGLFEEMFSGAGFEYLYFPSEKNYAVGFEVFEVIKRDYKLQFGTLDYRNTTGHINFYHRNYKYIPFDTKISYGEYLAGDVGATIQFSRSFRNGVEFGVFASFTNVSSEQFGEGSFDKGIFFNLPVFSNFINYSWRPLTKDPGAKLTRKNNLYDLLVKFKYQLTKGNQNLDVKKGIMSKKNTLFCKKVIKII